LAYVATGPKPAPDACFLCEALAGTEDRATRVAWRAPGCIVVLNKYPYNNGHLLVAPHAHKARLQDLESHEMLEIMQAVTRMTTLLQELMNPDGFNIGLNLGKAAGAGLLGHLHWHIVPRWNGDTNFMPVLADVRVIAQSLDSLYDMLRRRLSSDNGIDHPETPAAVPDP
jgi:ATP adenylyltransferase